MARTLTCLSIPKVQKSMATNYLKVLRMILLEICILQLADNSCSSKPFFIHGNINNPMNLTETKMNVTYCTNIFVLQAM